MGRSGADWVNPEDAIWQFASANGDGTGESDFVGDYSGAPAYFYIQPPVGEEYYLSRIMVQITDQGSFDANLYGNGVALVNGITIEIKRGGPTGTVLKSLTATKPIKRNADWGRFCYDVDVKTWGSGPQVLVARWTLAKVGAKVRLRGTDQQCLVFTLNDSFTALIDHTFNIQSLRV